MPEPNTQLAVMQPARLAPFQPVSFEDIEKFAVVISESELAPKDYRGKPANVCVAVLMGRELGIPPMQALQGIAVINGRPSVWGDLMWAIVTAHPDFVDCPETVSDTEATCVLKRRGRSEVSESFTQADAQKAGLWGKAGPWTQYPKRMLMWRARTFAARRQFADALKGIQVREEVQDYIEGEVIQREDPVAFADPAAGTKAEKPHTPATIVEAVTGKVSEPAKVDAPATITTEQSAEWNRVAKASGYSAADRSAYLKDVLQKPKTTEVPAERFDEMMAWARKEGVNQAAKPSDEEYCAATWEKLNTPIPQREEDLAKFTNEQGEIDWNTLALELHSRMEAGS